MPLKQASYKGDLTLEKLIIQGYMTKRLFNSDHWAYPTALSDSGPRPKQFWPGWSFKN